MKKILLLIFILASSYLSQDAMAIVDEPSYRLVWSDEFEIDGAPSSNNWFHQTAWIIPAVGWANGEAQHYTNRLDNSFVDNGVLKIVAKRETFTDEQGTKDFTSARLNSKYSFTYGKVEVRAKLPEGQGSALPSSVKSF